MTAIEAALDALKKAGSLGVSKRELIDAIYHHREDGGPMGADNVASTVLCNYNKVADMMGGPKIVHVGWRWYLEQHLPAIPLTGLQREYAIDLVTKMRSRFRHAAVLCHVRKKLRKHGIKIHLDSGGHYLAKEDVPAVKNLIGLGDAKCG